MKEVEDEVLKNENEKKKQSSFDDSASFVFSALALSLDTLARAFPQFPPVASVRRLVLVISPSPGEETKETPGEEIKLLFRKEESIDANDLTAAQIIVGFPERGSARCFRALTPV